jgi:hypothetical protein
MGAFGQGTQPVALRTRDVDGPVKIGAKFLKFYVSSYRRGDVSSDKMSSMWRAIISAVLIYGSGHPSLDGYRPALLDRPLQTFYLEVNQVGREGLAVIRHVDGQYVRSYVNRVDTQLRGGG